MFERYKMLSGKQKDKESYEQFWWALSDLARSFEIVINAEQKWIRDVFIFNMKNCDEDYFPEDTQARID